MSPAQFAQAVMSDLFERHSVVTAAIVATPEHFAAVQQRWKQQLSAMSAGIAHADLDDPTVPAREARLAQLQRVHLVSATEGDVVYGVDESASSLTVRLSSP